MNCNDSRRLLHLHRSGERAEKETTALRAHLAACASCAEEYRSVSDTEMLIETLRLTRPVMSDPDRFTADVLAALPARDIAVQRRVLRTVPAYVAAFVSYRTLRLVYSLVFLVTAAAFLLEYTDMISSRQALETRMSVSGRENTEHSWFVNAQDVREIVGEEKLDSVAIGAHATRSGDRFVIPQKTVDAVNGRFARMEDAAAGRILPVLQSEELRRLARHFRNASTLAIHFGIHGA